MFHCATTADPLAADVEQIRAITTITPIVIYERDWPVARK